MPILYYSIHYRPACDLRNWCLSSTRGRPYVVVSCTSFPLRLVPTSLQRNPLLCLVVAAPYAPLPSKERKGGQSRLRRSETADKNEDLVDLTPMKRASVVRDMVPFMPVKEMDDDGCLDGWVVVSLLGSAWRNTRGHTDAASEYRHGVPSRRGTLLKDLELWLHGNCAGTAVGQEMHDILFVGADKNCVGPGALFLAVDALTFMMKVGGVTLGEEYFRGNPYRAGLEF